MNENARPAFISWLKNAGITMTEFCCLAYISRSSFDRMLRGKTYLPTQYRVFLVTGLDEFKLAPSHLEKYQRSVALGKVDYWEEKISKHLSDVWKNTGKLPEVEYRLATGYDKYQDRKKLTEKIKKELLLVSDFVQVKPVFTEKTSQLETEDLAELHKKIVLFLSKATKKEVVEFVKNNKKLIEIVYSDFVVLTDPKPFEAAANVREKKGFFNP